MLLAKRLFVLVLMHALACLCVVLFHIVLAIMH
jgi:hypothetical protein